jgi:hypothetical protein
LTAAPPDSFRDFRDDLKGGAKGVFFRLEL